MDAGKLLFPAAPTIVAQHDRATVLTDDGELRVVSLDEAAEIARATPPIVCHRLTTFERLGIPSATGLDALELLAFVHPGCFCPPNPQGLASFLDLRTPVSTEDQPSTIREAARRLLVDLARIPSHDHRAISGIANAMAFGGWPWGSFVLSALGRPSVANAPSVEDLAAWRVLDEWEESPPSPPAGIQSIAEGETMAYLAELLGGDAEARPQQHEYAAGLVDAFAPRLREDEPRVVVAEAGTGVGKTLGYLAPAHLWATRNTGTVWFSTFTRNLQHQIEQEADRIFESADEKRRRVVVRKGRENYLCLLNFDERVRASAMMPQDYVPLGLIARWISVTRDGDLTGPNFPSWLRELFDWELTAGLADRRGECVYSACSHYKKCFIEATVRRAQHSEFVIANHALVLIQSALGGGEDMQRVTRFVFDEGHHLFDAADNVFSVRLTGVETGELRRWLLGPEGRRIGRGRGLGKRLEDLIAGDVAAEILVEEVSIAAASLPGPGWLRRLRDREGRGPVERFLACVLTTVLARNSETGGFYSLESDIHPVDESLRNASSDLAVALRALLSPLTQLSTHLQERLDIASGTMDSDTRRRIESIVRTMQHRAILQTQGWIDLLDTVISNPVPEFVDWISIDRSDGRMIDVGVHRHWLDPMQAFAENVGLKAHGVIITSATLRDEKQQSNSDWQAADLRTGASYLSENPVRLSIPSPFDFENQTRVLILTDVRMNALEQVSAAFRELFIAANGGALGLFTAINRLRDVHERIVGPLQEAGLSLYSQHVDSLSNPTLVEMFRADTNSCLLGTDAMRDGVDIPGRALRLLVFDRVPWARRSILHRARREHFGPRGAYDDMIARLRIKQAFGRLIRRADDRGVFVMVDSRVPSRLHSAFPEDAQIQRLGLAEAVDVVRGFLN